MRTNLIFALFGALVLAGCGGKGSPMGPSDPTVPTTLVGNVHGVVVEGTSATTATTQAVGDAFVNLKVSVEGHGLSAMTDSVGGFVLANVPAGAVTLRFEAAGVNARLGGLTVANGQTLSIRVGVAGNSATLLDEGGPTPTPTPTPGGAKVNLSVPQEYRDEVLRLNGGKTTFTNCFVPNFNLVVPSGYEREADFAKNVWAGIITFDSGPTVEVVSDASVGAEEADLGCGTGGKLLLNPDSLRNGGRLFAHGIGHSMFYDVDGQGLMGLGMNLDPAERWLALEFLRLYREHGFGATITLVQ